MKANPTGMIGSLPNPQATRALATGMGNSREEIEHTGLRRSQAVIDCAPKGMRRAGNGYPEPNPMMDEEAGEY